MVTNLINSKRRNYQTDLRWAVEKIQPIAIRKFYNKRWPNCKIIALDKIESGEIGKILDIGGADKMIQHQNGTVSFLAQRFRTYQYAKYDDFTIRYSRPSGKLTELQKILGAIENGTLSAAYYAYGHVNHEETDFIRFRIVDFRAFVVMLMKNELPIGKHHKNRDGSSGFLAWQFNSLPQKLILFEYLEGQTEFKGRY